MPPLKEDEPIADGETVRDCLITIRRGARLREWVAVVLQAVGPDPIVIKGLTECLAEPDPGVRDQATTLLCCFGPSARDAVSLLLPLLKHKHPGVHHAAAEALRKIDPEAAARAGVK